MKRIMLCEHCGSPYELDDADTDLHVCDECQPYDEDLIGMIEMEDFDARD